MASLTTGGGRTLILKTFDTSTDANNYTGSKGEVCMCISEETTNKPSLRLHDGKTAGGWVVDPAIMTLRFAASDGITGKGHLVMAGFSEDVNTENIHNEHRFGISTTRPENNPKQPFNDFMMYSTQLMETPSATDKWLISYYYADPVHEVFNANSTLTFELGKLPRFESDSKVPGPYDASPVAIGLNDFQQGLAADEEISPGTPRIVKKSS